ncbi:hypothetical protein OBRU01_16718, partial [Operophtera brumata]
MRRTPPPPPSPSPNLPSPPPTQRTKRHCPSNSPSTSHADSKLDEEMSTQIPNKQEEILTLLTKVLSEITEIRKSHSDMQKTLEFYTKTCEEMQERLVALEDEKVMRETYIRNLENRFEEVDRHARSTCLEIRGVPSKPTETKQDLCGLVGKLQDKLKVNGQLNTIKDIYRIKGKPNGDRPIVVDFTTTIMKTSILQAVKTHNAANTTDRLNTKFLTQKARRLYFLARDRAKICRYDFCWSASGRIFLRKAVGSAPI